MFSVIWNQTVLPPTIFYLVSNKQYQGRKEGGGAKEEEKEEKYVEKRKIFLVSPQTPGAECVVIRFISGSILLLLFKNHRLLSNRFCTYFYLHVY